MAAYPITTAGTRSAKKHSDDEMNEDIKGDLWLITTLCITAITIAAVALIIGAVQANEIHQLQNITTQSHSSNHPAMMHTRYPHRR
jgi:hypothetical protein